MVRWKGAVQQIKFTCRLRCLEFLLTPAAAIGATKTNTTVLLIEMAYAHSTHVFMCVTYACVRSKQPVAQKVQCTT